MKSKTFFTSLAILALFLVVSGCGGGDESGVDPNASGPATGQPGPDSAGGPAGPSGPAGPGGPAPAPAGPAPAAPAGAPAPEKKAVNGVILTAQAGVPVTATADPTLAITKGFAMAKYSKSRVDPFALLAYEKQFESSQSAARIVDELGGFTTMFTPEKEPEDEGEVTVPAPPGLRLAGIILGNGIVALLEIQGKVVDIRPGSIVAEEWVVASIDEEKAVLRRLNKKRPHEIVVPLVSKLDLGNGAADSGGGSGGGSGSGPNGPSGGGERGARGGGRSPEQGDR